MAECGAGIRASSRRTGSNSDDTQALREGMAMSRDEVLGLLRAHKKALAQRYGVAEVKLYGSFARDQAADDSDVDVLVRFDEVPDWRRYFGAQAYLEDLLGATGGHGDDPGAEGGDTSLRGAGAHRCLMPSRGYASGASTLRT